MSSTTTTGVATEGVAMVAQPMMPPNSLPTPTSYSAASPIQIVNSLLPQVACGGTNGVLLVGIQQPNPQLAGTAGYLPITSGPPAPPPLQQQYQPLQQAYVHVQGTFQPLATSSTSAFTMPSSQQSYHIQQHLPATSPPPMYMQQAPYPPFAFAPSA